MKADKIYDEIVRICRYITDRRAEGWLLIHESGEVESRAIVFSSPFNDKCVSFWSGGNSWSTLVVYGQTDTWGADTLLQEYEKALESLKCYRLFEPKEVHKL